ncbi:MAG: tetratricopeptide repeat protein, partial [Terriglobales bacterium]
THGGGDYIAEALTHYKAAMAADPQSAYIASQTADLLSRLGRNADAITLEQATLKQHPESLAAHQTLANIYLRQLSHMPQPISAGKGAEVMSAAIAEYKTLIALQPKNATPVVILGKLYGASGQPQQAEQQFRAALQIDSTNSDAVASLVQSLASQDRLDDAENVIDGLPEAARTGQVYATLGDAYLNRRQFPEAARAFRNAVAARPDDPDFQNALAQALMDGGDYAAALTEFQRLQRETPNDGHAALRVAQLELQLGQLGAAREALHSAAALLPKDDIEVAYAGVLLDARDGHDSAAMASLQDLLRRPAGAASKGIFLEQLARLQARNGDSAGALKSLRQMAALGPNYRTRAQVREIALYAEQHDYTKALNSAQQALAAEPGSRALHITYANLLSLSGQPEQALASLQPLLKNDAGDWDLYLAMSRIHVQSQQLPAALADTTRAAALASTPAQQAEVANQVSAIQARRKDYKAAEQTLRHALTVDPGNATSLNALAYLLAEQNKELPQALGLVQQALARDPNNGAYLDSLGWIYFKMNRLPDALSQLERAARLQQHDPAILDHLAQAYDRDGKLQQAASSWTEALADLKAAPAVG